MRAAVSRMRYYLKLFGTAIKRRRASEPRISPKAWLHSLVDSQLSNEQQVQIREVELLKEILLCALDDVASKLGLNLAPERDTIISRTEAEGKFFILSLMPRFYQHVLYCIEKRAFTPLSSFKGMRGGRERLPAFLQGLLLTLFTKDGNYISPVGNESLAEKQAMVLVCLKQLCTGFGYKYEFPASDARYDEQLREAIDREKQIFSVDDMCLAAGVDGYFDQSGEPYFLAKEDHGHSVKGYSERLCMVAKEQCEKVMRGFDPVNIVPKHGPGAVFDVATKHPHEKYLFDKLPRALERLYPEDSYFNPTPSIPLSGHQMAMFTGGRPDEYEYRGGRLTPPSDPIGVTAKAIALGGASRGTMVAKNADKGRQINIELKEEMFIQKGLQSKLYDWIENSPYLQVKNSYLTRSMVIGKRFGKRFCQINFTDQTINQAWALEASRTGEYATLDLSDASTYLSRAVVAYLLPNELREYFFAARSKYVFYRFKVNGDEMCGEWVRTETFAPMGSAICFPMEALVFWSICTAALKLEGCETPIFVYGDDLIVPTRHSEKVIRALTTLGLRVNDKKSFIHGHFRESCGVDAFRGIDVSAPCRVKKRFPFIKREFMSGFDEAEAAPHVAAWVDYSNSLQASGFRNAARYIRQRLAHEFPREHRWIVEKTAITGYESYLCYLVDEVIHQPRAINDAYPSHGDIYLSELKFHGVTVGNRQLRPLLPFEKRISSVFCPRTMRTVLATNDEDHTSIRRLRIMGLSVKSENYYLRGEDHGFTDSHALFRSMIERCEDSRRFSLKQCSLKIAEHYY